MHSSILTGCGVDARLWPDGTSGCWENPEALKLSSGFALSDYADLCYLIRASARPTNLHTELTRTCTRNSHAMTYIIKSIDIQVPHSFVESVIKPIRR